MSETLRLRVLTPEQCAEIHHATLEILEDVGVLVHDDAALETLRRGGAFVDGNRVRFPSALVEKAVHSAPSRVVLCDRNGNRKIFLEGNKFYFGPGPTNNYVLDPLTGERRKPALADTRLASTVIDALPNIDFQMDMGTPQDVPPARADVLAFAAMLSTSPKPIVHWGFGVPGYRAMLEMGLAVAGSLRELQACPFFCLYSEPTSPLQHSRDAVQKLLFMAEYNLPVIYTPAPMAGATAPVTMAGTLIISLAENLSGLVIHQLTREGAPFIMGGVATVMDMRSTILSYGAPELSLLSAALTDMAHYYRIPMFSTAGCTDAKTVDGQAAAEAAFSCLSAALSGANLIHDVGYIEYGSTSSLEMLAIGDELIAMVKRILRGVPADAIAAAVGEIRRVGPGGHFLDSEHTARHFRQEVWTPALMDRQRYDVWLQSGAQDLRARARARVRAILEGHVPEKLEGEASKKVESILCNSI